MPRFIRSFALSLLVMFTAADSLAATFLVDGYSVRVWQTDDGLPQNMVTCGVQTQDGYLWFGTYSGLARFNGERFEVFDSVNSSGIEDRRIARLYEDRQGTLWLGHDSGIVTRYRDGRFEQRTRPPAGPNAKIIGLGGDEHDRIWAMHENGIIESLDDGTLLPSLLGDDHPGVMSFSRGAQGNIWMSENGTAARLVAGKVVPAELPPPRGTNYVLCVAGASDGGAWILCDDRVRKWRNGQWTEDRGDRPWPSSAIACALELRNGVLAVGTIQSGLYLVFGDGRPAVHFDAGNGLPQNWVRFLFEDREGNLWAGAGSAGLVSIHASPFSVLTTPDAGRLCSVLSVAAGPDGALWVGTDGRGLYCHQAGRWAHYGPPEGLTNWYIPAVAIGPQGTVWASDFWWGGPYRLDQGRFAPLAGIEEKSNPAFALLPTHEPGELFIGNRDGLRRWQDGRWSWLAKSPDESAPEVCAIARQRDGVIWCGFGHGGIARIADGRVSHYRQADGLASDAIHSLLVEDDGTLWVGTADHGLSRFKAGRFANLRKEQGLVDHAVCGILDDGLGYLWLSTHHGLQRVSKDELNRCADGATKTFASQVFDRSDGLPVVEFTGGFQSVACKTPDGRLWFASSMGVVGVDPRKIESNPISPPVVLESVLVDGKVVTPANDAVPQDLKADHQRLEFRFSGLSFVAPSKVFFRYRLEGIDQTWVDAGTRRSAFYSRLPAGSYRFRVIACNNDGVWNLDGAALAFTVAPFFWQTWWFITSCLLAAAVAIAWLARLITRRRMQRKIEHMQRQHEIERERSRIAQDIHDDVGASLSRIAMLSQPAPSQLAEPDRAAAVLSRIYTTAREVTRALDEIVWAIDPRHDTLDSLVDYMGRFAQGFLAAANIRCRLDLPVEVPAWPLSAEIRHNLFLAFKEALNNAVKHAVATEVRISLSLRPHAFVLLVKDNGRGFVRTGRQPSDPARLSSGNGLLNMQRRLDRIGGNCEITTNMGEGTCVALTVKIGRAALPTAEANPAPTTSQPLV